MCTLEMLFSIDAMNEDPSSLQISPAVLGTPPLSPSFPPFDLPELDWSTIDAQMEGFFNFDLFPLDGQLAEKCTSMMKDDDPDPKQFMDVDLSDIDLSAIFEDFEKEMPPQQGSQEVQVIDVKVPDNAATKPIMSSQGDAVPHPCINSHGLSEGPPLGNPIIPPTPINETIAIESDSDDVSLPTLSSLLSRATKRVPEANHDDCDMFDKSKQEGSNEDGVRQSIQSNMSNARPLRPRPAQKRSYALVQDDEIGKGAKNGKGVKGDKGVQTETSGTFKSQDTSRLSERQASMMVIVEELLSNAAHGITNLENFAHQMEQNLRGIRIVQDKQKELIEEISKLTQEG
ncbi:MAG: hypothetical protein MMC33_008619 [Icmadophila ericetorum]|nr:hypothetical protein [Icmadophila ericetorum]